MRYSNANVEVGDIFVASWGYGQTNVSPFQVVEKKGKASVVVREIGTIAVMKDGETTAERYQRMYGQCLPVKNQFQGTEVLIDDQKNGSMVRVQLSEKGEPFICVGRGRYRASRWDGVSPCNESWGY